MLLGFQPAIAAEEYCVSIPSKDKTVPENELYRNGITKYYDKQDKITIKYEDCKEEVLHIESYKPVKQKSEKIPIISVRHDKTKENDPYQFFLTPKDDSFKAAVDSYMKKRLGDEKAEPMIIANNSRWSSWPETSEDEPKYVFMRGKDVNIPFAIQSANYLDYPVSKLIGYTWDNHDEDLENLGEIANGYQTLSVINATTSKLFNEIGKDSNNTYWKLGVLAAIISSEAISFARTTFGNSLNSGQVRWALENLNLSKDDLKGIGIGNLVSPIKMDCNNHNILHEIYIQRWDADKPGWDSIYDFIDENDGNEGKKCMDKELLKVILDRSSNKEQKLKALNALPEAEIKTLDYANFSNITLTEVNLSRADLSGADLSGADLSGANLTRANLTGANLSRARLTEANLSKAVLSGARLTETNLSGATLTEATLSEAYFFGTNLSGANLAEATLSEASFFGTNLSGVVLSGVDISEAYFFGNFPENFDHSKVEKNQGQSTNGEEDQEAKFKLFKENFKGNKSSPAKLHIFRN